MSSIASCFSILTCLSGREFSITTQLPGKSCKFGIAVSASSAKKNLQKLRCLISYTATVRNKFTSHSNLHLCWIMNGLGQKSMNFKQEIIRLELEAVLIWGKNKGFFYLVSKEDRLQINSFRSKCRQVSSVALVKLLSLTFNIRIEDILGPLTYVVHKNRTFCPLGYLSWVLLVSTPHTPKLPHTLFINKNTTLWTASTQTWQFLLPLNKQ